MYNYRVQCDDLIYVYTKYQPTQSNRILLFSIFLYLMIEELSESTI